MLPALAIIAERDTHRFISAAGWKRHAREEQQTVSTKAVNSETVNE